MTVGGADAGEDLNLHFEKAGDSEDGGPQIDWDSNLDRCPLLDIVVDLEDCKDLDLDTGVFV